MSKKITSKHLLSIITCTAVAAPILCLPIGMRETKSASSKVRAAYANTYENIAETLPEEEFIVDENTDFTAGEGTLISSTYYEGYAPVEDLAYYGDVENTYMVSQAYDSANLPIELLDPEFFEPDETQYYVQAANSILKESPDMDSITLENLFVGQGVIRTGIGDTWSQVVTESGNVGYVLTSSLSYEMIFVAIDRTIWVDTGSLTLRAEPSTSADVVATLTDETRLRATGISDKWYHVFTESGLEGYVYISYTTQTAPPTPTPVPRQNNTNNSGNRGGNGGGGGSGSVSSGSNYTPPVISGVNGSSIVAVAESVLGVSYVFGGESSSGLDCSGLVVYCYRYVGVGGLPHLADSLKNYGVAVDRSNIQPGDIVCYDYGGGYCNHVALYVGGGQVIHASNSRGNVRYGNLDMMPILTIRRVIG